MRRFRPPAALGAALLTLCALTLSPAAAAGPTPQPARVQAKALAAASVTANFGADAGPGHAEVFGSGINVPALTDVNKLDTLHQTGTTFVRGDAYLGHILPDTTIPAYLAAMAAGNTGVADPATWDWSHYDWVDRHHDRGAKIVLILSYSVDWLGYTPGGGEFDFSPPRGADGYRVYEDVIGKIYRHFQGKVDLIEVWNEPDGGFMDLGAAGTPYPNNPRGRLAAYKDIYFHAARAIRAIDPAIPIGGPAKSNEDPMQYDADPANNVNWPLELLQDARIRDNVNFLSYHVYDEYRGVGDEAVTRWKQVAADAGKGSDFPVYVTEWNHDWRYAGAPLNGNHPNAISYAARRLTQFYKQHANGTNYFADNDESIVWEFFGVHRNGTLPPKARAYKLLADDLGLGDGRSTIRPVTFPATLANAGAATTAGGSQVAWVVNDSDEPVEVDLRLNGLGSATAVTANLFEAAAVQSRNQPKAAIPLTVSGGSATVRFGAPARSVVGVRLGAAAVADTANLATSATVTPSSVTAAHPELSGGNVIDGVIGVHGTGEWASNAEMAPSIRLSWPTAQQVGKVVLYDRANPTDRVLGGRLEFSDGSSVGVPELPNHATTAREITFPARSTTFVRFVANGTGLNVGLSELQVFAGDNVARDGTVTASSRTGYNQLNAVDGGPAEWVSNQTDPWIQATWVNDQVLDRVVLSDRPGAADANGGTLTFSDGSSVPVSGIPADGSPKLVSFPARAVKWVRFQVAGGSGAGVGLTEFRILAAGNVATSAVVTATSVSTADPTLTPAAATDGVVNQWFAGEWASNRELSPRIRLTWPTAQSLRQVMLYDRSNAVDHVTGGTLTFSDGSTVAVSGLDNTGTGKRVTFAPRSVTWVEFAATSASGTWNAGLSEFEAYN